MNVIFALSEGIGNVFQALPVVTSLEQTKGWEFSYLICQPNYAIGGDVLNRSTYQIDDIKPGFFDGFDAVITTGRAWNLLEQAHLTKGAKLLNDPKKQLIKNKQDWTKSEVDWRLDIVRDQGVSEKNLCWNYQLNYSHSIDRQYDVVLADGYNRSTKQAVHWAHKSYPRWEEVVALLQDAIPELSICSIGSPNEYVSGTVNETGLSLQDSLGLIRKSRVLLANDTGVFHAAALLDTPSVIVVTFTKPDKICDRRFHKRALLLYNDVQCRKGCYEKRIYRKCKNNYICKDLLPKQIVEGVITTFKKEHFYGNIVVRKI